MADQHTLGHLDCPACLKAKNDTMYGERLGECLFPEAAQLWLRGRKSISERTAQHYRDYIQSLTVFFAKMQLKQIHIGHVATYQQSRQAQIRGSVRHRASKTSRHPLPTDGASRINHELSCLGQILRKAGLWQDLKRFYEPLPLPKESPGMAITEEEERHLFAIARTNPRWRLAYLCAIVSRNTTAGPGEIRCLRLCDVELDTPHGSFLHIVEGVKNEFRKRPVPLNDDARKAIEQLVDRAHRLGASEPQHYLLPHRAARRGELADPTRPMGSWKKAHWAMCAEAAKKFPRLARMRLYDYRHTAATDLLEDPSISYTTIEHMMGHRLHSKTKRKYDHLRNSALRVAADVLSKRGAALFDDEPEPEQMKKKPARSYPLRSELVISGTPRR